MDENKNNINNSKQIPLNTEENNSKVLNQFTSEKGIISNYKDPQILKIENIINPNKNFSDKPTVKEILNQKDIKFTKE